MIKAVAVVTLLFGVTLAAPHREKRQAACVGAFQNVPSPCKNNPSNRVYFPHPTDITKFLQCDIYSRMYIIQCPQGEVYDNSRAVCTPQNAATNTPVVAPVVTQAPPVTQAPVSNPCTRTAISRGQLYFPVSGDKTKFIECDLAGNPQTLACPNGLLWDQGMLSCVYPIVATGNPPVQPTSGLPTTVTNPCNAAAIKSNHFFFPHPDATKFIQCDLWGQSFVVSCPSGLIWNAYLETCYRSQTVVVGPNNGK